MKSRFPGLVLLFFVILATLGVPAGAEELRTIVAGTAAISGEVPEGVKFSVAYNEAVAITLPKESPFIQGFEIEVKIPQAAVNFPGALAYELWRRLDPAPDKNRFGYEGDRIITQPLPPRGSLVLQVPIRKDHNLKTTPYATVLPTILEARDFPLVFKFYAISKGMPPELENAEFQVRIRPLLTDEGALRLSLRFPDGADKSSVALSLDDKRLPDGRYLDGRELLVLKAGTHYLRVSSEKFRDESRTFTVDQGRILDLVVELQDTTPLLVIEAPDSAQISIDGQRLVKEQRTSLNVEVGEHTVSCRIGDYVITRKFSAYRGKTYRLVLSVDLQVQEQP